MSYEPPRDETLAERFRPVFARIAEGAAARDHERILAHDAVQWLRDAGFGGLRVPQHLGGLGASVEQLFDLLIELGEADSNLPQALRAHFALIERLTAEIGGEQVEPWLKLAAQGVIFGNAISERGDNAVGELKTVLRRSGEGWLLEGEKFYSTGTLYADWIQVSARREDESNADVATLVLVPGNAPGVERIDDWTGFGQKLSASGTTRFHGVAVPDRAVFSYARRGPTPLTAQFQLTHLATLAGIARAIVRDTVAYVRPRKRVYSHGTGSAPAQDPLVQQVVGELSATAFLAVSAVRAAARSLGDADRARLSGAGDRKALLERAELDCARAQVVVADAVLKASTQLFDVGGASALAEDKRLDRHWRNARSLASHNRHWRNARSLASHNPTFYKARLLGDQVINGTAPPFYWSVGQTG